MPDGTGANFVDFKVSVDGVPVAPSVEERVTAMGVDRTAELRRLGLPLNPIAEGLYDRLAILPDDVKAELNRLGLAYVDAYSVQAAWRLETTFYWEQTFPPARKLLSSTATSRWSAMASSATTCSSDADYKAKYCIDERLRPRGAQEARRGRRHRLPLSQRAAAELHPDHRQQLVRPDRRIPPDGRQGQLPTRWSVSAAPASPRCRRPASR